jgi:hypothetical protein
MEGMPTEMIFFFTPWDEIKIASVSIYDLDNFGVFEWFGSYHCMTYRLIDQGDIQQYAEERIYYEDAPS